MSTLMRAYPSLSRTVSETDLNPIIISEREREREVRERGKRERER